MDPKELALNIAQVLSEKKGEDIILLDVEALLAYTSYFVIASGRSTRQVKAMAGHLERYMKAITGRPLGAEGAAEGRWAVLDYGDVVVHIFQNDERYIYDLEGLWVDAPKELFESQLESSA